MIGKLVTICFYYCRLSRIERHRKAGFRSMMYLCNRAQSTPKTTSKQGEYPPQVPVHLAYASFRLKISGSC